MLEAQKERGEKTCGGYLTWSAIKLTADFVVLCGKLVFIYHRYSSFPRKLLWERNSAVFLWSQYSTMNALQIKKDWRDDK